MESSTAQFLLRQSACVQLPMINIIIVHTLLSQEFPLSQVFPHFVAVWGAKQCCFSFWVIFFPTGGPC